MADNKQGEFELLCNTFLNTLKTQNGLIKFLIAAFLITTISLAIIIAVLLLVI